MSNEPKLRKNMFLLILLVIAGSIIYMLPYFRSYYYDAFKAAFGMTNTEIGRCGTYYGLFGAISYLVGGYIADKISFKALIPGSLIVTGVLGLYLLTVPSPFIVAVVHGIWGITSLMTFWPALVKALRAVGNQNEQGRVFGIFEGGRGVVNGVVYAIAAAMFAAFMSEVNPFSGIAQLLIMYSVLPIVLGVLLIFALRNVDNVHEEDASNKINFKLIATALKNPGIWLASLMMLFAYIISVSFYYFAPYATSAFGVSVLAAAIISSSSTYIRPISAVGSGFLADRISSSKVYLIGEILVAIGLLFVIFTPVGTSIIPVLIGCVVVYFAVFMNQSMYFAILEEIHIPSAVSGTAIGLMCTIGYLPDAFVPTVVGRVLDSYPEGSYEGYRVLFYMMLSAILISIVLTLLWLRNTRERRAEILSSRHSGAPR